MIKEKTKSLHRLGLGLSYLLLFVVLAAPTGNSKIVPKKQIKNNDASEQKAGLKAKGPIPKGTEVEDLGAEAKKLCDALRGANALDPSCGPEGGASSSAAASAANDARGKNPVDQLVNGASSVVEKLDPNAWAHGWIDREINRKSALLAKMCFHFGVPGKDSKVSISAACSSILDRPLLATNNSNDVVPGSDKLVGLMETQNSGNPPEYWQNFYVAFRAAEAQKALPANIGQMRTQVEAQRKTVEEIAQRIYAECVKVPTLLSDFEYERFLERAKGGKESPPNRRNKYEKKRKECDQKYQAELFAHKNDPVLSAMLETSRFKKIIKRDIPLKDNALNETDISLMNQEAMDRFEDQLKGLHALKARLDRIETLGSSDKALLQSVIPLQDPEVKERLACSLPISDLLKGTLLTQVRKDAKNIFPSIPVISNGIEEKNPIDEYKNHLLETYVGLNKQAEGIDFKYSIAARYIVDGDYQRALTYAIQNRLPFAQDMARDLEKKIQGYLQAGPQHYRIVPNFGSGKHENYILEFENGMKVVTKPITPLAQRQKDDDNGYAEAKANEAERLTGWGRVPISGRAKIELPNPANPSQLIERDVSWQNVVTKASTDMDRDRLGGLRLSLGRKKIVPLSATTLILDSVVLANPDRRQNAGNIMRDNEDPKREYCIDNGLAFTPEGREEFIRVFIKKAITSKSEVIPDSEKERAMIVKGLNNYLSHMDDSKIPFADDKAQSKLEATLTQARIKLALEVIEKNGAPAVTLNAANEYMKLMRKNNAFIDRIAEEELQGMIQNLSK